MFERVFPNDDPLFLHIPGVLGAGRTPSFLPSALPAVPFFPPSMRSVFSFGQCGSVVEHGLMNQEVTVSFPGRARGPVVKYKKNVASETSTKRN